MESTTEHKTKSWQRVGVLSNVLRALEKLFLFSEPTLKFFCIFGVDFSLWSAPDEWVQTLPNQRCSNFP
jgi:hypothetical protein